MPPIPSQLNKGLIHVKPGWRDLKRGTKRRLAGAAINPGGQWNKWLPTDEHQAKFRETSACASFGTLNAGVEILEKKKFGEHNNWSDRFLAKMSGTDPNRGNDPHKVAQTLRKKGTVYESDWPNTFDFYAPIPFEIQVDAQVKFKGKYDFGHQWVGEFTGGIRGFFGRILSALFPRFGASVIVTPEVMMEALEHSPLGADFDAWHFDPNTGYAIRTGPSGHWGVITGYKYGVYWDVLDTYPPYRKKAAWNYGFTMVKEYTLDAQILDDTLWGKAIRWLQQFI